MHVEVIQIEGIRIHRRRPCKGSREDGISDGRIDIEGNIEGIINFGPREVEAITLDEAVVGEGVEIWTRRAF